MHLEVRPSPTLCIVFKVKITLHLISCDFYVFKILVLIIFCYVSTFNICFQKVVALFRLT